MNAETFCEHFATFADAPNGLEKLRAMILQLAFQGKLVKPEPADEEVINLLARNDERRHETAQNDHRADIENQPLLSADDRWEIPNTWSWRGLADLVLFVDYRGKTPAKLPSGVRLLTAKNVRKGRIDLCPEEFLSEREYNDWMTRGTPKSGDVLFTTEAPMGNAAVVELTERFALAQRVICFQSYGGIDSAFLVHQILSEPFQSMLDKNGTGVTAKGIKASKLKQLPIAVPPLAEQRRIVEKVDQLLGLCDELAARQATQREKRQRLVGATLDRLVSTRNPAEFPTQAHRLRNNFDKLFDIPTTIPELRQTILQLAVQGKLVTQDPNDEPASVLVEKISNFKANVTGKPSKIPSLESLPNDVPLPNGWIAARFGDIMVNRDGERIPVSRDIREGRKGPYDYYGASGVIDCIDDFLFDKPLLLIGEDGANLINRSTPIAFIAEGKYWVNNHAHVLDGISVDFLRYIELHINAIDLKPFVTGTAQPKMNQAKMNSIPIAIPPAAEQKRIVTKVTELLSLCDAVEAKLIQAESASTQLLSAAVHHLLNGAVTNV